MYIEVILSKKDKVRERSNLALLQKFMNFQYALE